MINKQKYQETTAMIVAFLIERRKELKYNQIELAEKAGIGERTLQRIETSKFAPNLETLLRLCEALDLYFFCSPKESDEDFAKLMKSKWGNISDN